MRELTLGYLLPANLTKKIGAKRVTVSVFGLEIFLFCIENLKIFNLKYLQLEPDGHTNHQ
ncbi:MAG: hypothetical protein IPH28_19935 [Cytophagaceae bacterium]|nr:hypothetical protein [Cytophagaceae bacterium]